MNEEKEPVVPVPAGVLAALLAAYTFANCKTINHKEMLEIISNQAEEVEEGLSGTISMLSLAYVIFETEKTHGEKAAKKVTSEILGKLQGEKKELVARFVADTIDDFEKMYRGDEHERH